MQFLAILATLSAVAGSALAYDNNCHGSTLCGANSIREDCQKAIASVNPGGTYTDQTQFSVGHCYSESLSSSPFPRRKARELTFVCTASAVIYAAGSGKGAQPISGQRIIDTANNIMTQCSRTCGSFGTDNAGCDTCHITLNYRA